MQYIILFRETATSGSAKRKLVGSQRHKSERGFYRSLVAIIIFALPVCLYSQPGSLTHLRRTHYYEGKPITEFKTPSLKVDLKSGLFSSQPPAIYERTAYCSTDSGKVFSIGFWQENDVNGHEMEDLMSLSPRSYSCTGAISGTPAIDSHFVVVGSASNQLIAFDRLSSAIRWKYKTKAAIHSSPLLVNNLIYVGCDDGKLYALDTLGKLKWKFDLKAPAASPAYDDSIIYIGTQKSLIVALKAESGREIWRSTAGGRTPCIGDSLLYIINQNGALIALDKKNGIERWRYDNGDTISSKALEPVLAPTMLLYTADKTILAFDPASGIKKWDKEFLQTICGNPIIVSDVAYVPCSDFHLYGVDLATGLKLAQADIGFAPYGTPAFGDGKIFYPSKKVLYILMGKE